MNFLLESNAIALFGIKAFAGLLLLALIALPIYLFYKQKKRLAWASLIFVIPLVTFGIALKINPPKNSLDVPVTSSYQRPEVNKEIVSPPPRTEKLEGFKPLGSN